ncbi:MAG TPA: hypothetical protein ENJ41_08715, partial [Oceanospirillales bacterium]|nr:hypothetical protein [Oceanospirillales bacterium]
LVKLEIFRTFAHWFSLAGLIFIFTFLFVAPSKQLLPSFKTTTSDIKAARDNPVFVIVLDEFPLLALLKNNMEIDESRFPTFAKLAQQATWYTNATAIASATELALPSILSGIKPSLKKVRSGTHEQYPYNLFTLFSNSHKIHAVENSTRMCPSHLCQSVIDIPFKLLLEDVYVSFLYIIYPKDTRHKLPPINNSWIGFMRELDKDKRKTYDFSQRLNKFETFTSAIEKYPTNTLHFLHILLPHAPWTILPNFDLYGFYERDGLPGELDKTQYSIQYNHQWTDDSWATQLSWRRELLQIGAVDALVEKMLEKIKSLGLYDEATIVIVSDHGAAFIPGLSRRYAHSENITDIVKIPLFIKYPQQTKGKVDNRNASNVDILPTLLDVFSIDPVEELDGISLIGNSNRSNETEMVQEKYALTALPDNHQSIFKNHIKDKNALFWKPAWQGVYHPRDTQAFYGKDIQELQVQKHIPNGIKLWNSNLYREVKADGKYKPVYYRLTTLGDDLHSKEILLSINGTLVSHCYLFVHAKNDCAGLIDPEIYAKFSQQTLNLQFFSVKSYANNVYTVDELLDVGATNAQIISTNNQESIQFNNDEIFPIKNIGAPFGGASLLLTDNNSTYLIDGWAGDTVSGKKAEKILIFIDDKLLSTTDTGIPKNYLLSRYGHRKLIDSGFQVMIPVEQYPDIQNHKIRVFASFDQQSWNELNYHISPQRELFTAFNTKNNRAFPINVDAIFAEKLNQAGNKNIVGMSKIDAFGENFDLISAGDWFPIAKHKRWLGKEAFIKLVLDKDVKNPQLSIKAKPIIYAEINTQQRMKVYINDKLIDEVRFTTKQTMTVSLDTKHLEKEKQNLLKLEFPDALSPQLHGKGNDTRNLSLYVYDFKIE